MSANTILKAVMCSAAALVLVTLVLFEAGVLPQGSWTGDNQLEFMVLTLMELVTICLIPIALRLFKFGKVRDDLRAGGESALRKWGIVRMDMLCVPMFLNVVFYELFLHTAFGYMAILLAICLAFVFSTKTRCESELNPES